MPSLDALKTKPELKNIKIFPINIGKDSLKKSEQFFNELNIKNLNIYFVLRNLLLIILCFILILADIIKNTSEEIKYVHPVLV
jgi:hypothetical protein